MFQIPYKEMLLIIYIIWNGDSLTFTTDKHSIDFSVIIIAVHPLFCLIQEQKVTNFI